MSVTLQRETNHERSFDRQVMTSLEIAQVTGKQHKNVMQAIRNMEPAWEKTCGLKFQLTSRNNMDEKHRIEFSIGFEKQNG